MRIETTQILDEQTFQYLPRPRLPASVPKIIGSEDRVGIRIIRIRAGQHLFHLVHRPWATRDNGSRPLFDRFALLAPIFLSGIPDSPVMQL